MGVPRTKGRILIVLALAGLLAVAAFALAAANTVPGTRAGDGNGTISGYTVTNVSYNLNAVNPSLVSTYEFDLDAAATTVKAKLITAQVTYDNCTGLVNHWTCTPPVGTTVASIDQLRVIAAQ